MKKTITFFAALAFAAPAARMARAAELQADTLMAWNAYVKTADARMRERAETRLPFLWMDESPERATRVRRGEVAVEPAVGHGSEGAPHGLIHDWIGAIFIPGATVNDLLAVVRDYDRYQSIYRPVVASSKTIGRGENSHEFQMVWQRKVLFVRAALQGQYRTRDAFLDTRRGYSVAEAVQVREIEGYGHSGEHLLPPDTGNGFIWRIRSMSRFEERDGGVYLELEALALTREIPAGLAWMVNPAVNHLSINSLITTLRQTRDAVISSRGRIEISGANSPRMIPFSPAEKR